MEEYKLKATLEMDVVVITADGLNTEVRCTEGVLQLRKHPTGITLKEVDCPRKDTPDRLPLCLSNGCRLINDVIPVPRRREDGDGG